MLLSPSAFFRSAQCRTGHARELFEWIFMTGEEEGEEQQPTSNTGLTSKGSDPLKYFRAEDICQISPRQKRERDRRIFYLHDTFHFTEAITVFMVQKITVTNIYNYQYNSYLPVEWQPKFKLKNRAETWPEWWSESIWLTQYPQNRLLQIFKKMSFNCHSWGLHISFCHILCSLLENFFFTNLSPF